MSVALMVLLCTGELRAEWEVTTYQGRSYVSVEDLAGFYGFGEAKRNGNNFVLSRPGIELAGRGGEKAIAINRLKLFLSYPVLKWGKGNKLLVSAFDVTHTIDAVLRPPRQKEARELKTVVIDASHGGDEEGVRSKAFGNEKVHVLAVAQRLESVLETQGYTVMMTRVGDEAVSPVMRAGVANDTSGEAIFVTLHVNGTGTKGVETYVAAPAGTPATYDPAGTKPDLNYYLGNLHEGENAALAAAVHGSLIVSTRAPDLGIKRARFRELRAVGVPGIMIRLGNLSHPEEGIKLADTAYQETLAGAIADGIGRYGKYLLAGGKTAGKEAVALTLAGVSMAVPEGDAEEGAQVVQVKIGKTEGAEIDPAKVDVEVYFLDLVDGEYLEPASALPPEVNWSSVLPDWAASETEELEVVLRRGVVTPALEAELGKRKVYGYVVRLLYDGKLQAVSSAPKRLERCLYQFYSVAEER
ncbi:MAG: N-acetylmuramoyl-L-alanine amidase [Verrucomicrobiales bacterium]|nr:N-acetylmuramoyl-L-alanine amidase [Verrucomicrobiales bacterium]